LEGETAVILHYLKIEKPSIIYDSIQEQILELGYNYRAKVAPINFEIKATPIKKGCSLSCSFSYSAQLPCARCLKDVTVEGDTFFIVELKQKSSVAEITEDADVEDKEIDEIFLDEETFDTKELVTEQLFLLLPEKVLCKEDCKGLCPKCGSDRNTTVCKCGDSFDPRWEPLSKFKKTVKE